MKNNERNILAFIFLFSGSQSCLAQNLVLNPGAEGLPLGTKWNMVSTGANACAVGTAASTYSAWTMTPDNSTNYPAAHGGTKTFFAGCNTIVPAGTFELSQDIDVSADASQIDAGNIAYLFSGYIQTPVPPQPDAGRFVVDYLSAGSVILGTSYSSSYQSYSNCTCSGWVLYSNLRAAVAGTRKVRVRLQSTITIGPAINAYFDDISLTKSTPLPIVLVSFEAKEITGRVELSWVVSDADNFSGFEVEKSSDAGRFETMTTITYLKGQASYQYSDPFSSAETRVFYRLKLIDPDGHYAFSIILPFNSSSSQTFTVSPNPAGKYIMVTGLHARGKLTISSINGKKIFERAIKGSEERIDLEQFTKGIYILSYLFDNSSESEKFMIH